MVPGRMTVRDLPLPRDEPRSLGHRRNVGRHVGAAPGPMGRYDNVSRPGERRFRPDAKQKQRNRGDRCDRKEHAATLSLAHFRL